MFEEILFGVNPRRDPHCSDKNVFACQSQLLQYSISVKAKGNSCLS